MTALKLLPALLSLLVLAAHFSRAGMPVLVGLSLGATALLAVRRPWATWILQAVLYLGALEWIRTAIALASARQDAGLPWLRLAIILGAVALVSIFATVLLRKLPWSRRG